MIDEDIARNRLLIYSLVRLGGVGIVFLGIAIIYTNLVRAGGFPRLGALIVILGAIDALFAPRLLKKGWDQRDRERQ